MTEPAPAPPAAAPRVERTLLLLPGAAVATIASWWSLAGGGYEPTRWYPGTLLLLGLLVATVAGRGSRGSWRSAWTPSILLAGLTAWSFASIAWATVKGDAWEGATRTALYLVVFFLVVRWRWGRADAVIVLTGLSTVVAAVGLLTLVRAAHAADPGRFLVDGRLSDPVGYPNAAAALYLLAFWPAAVLASRREVSLPLRLLQVVVATVLLELSAIPESRGATYTLPLVLLVALVLVPARLRLVAALLPVGLATGLSLHRLWAPFSSRSTPGGLHPALVGALEAVLVSAVAVGIVAAALLVLDARWRPGPRAAAAVRRSFSAAVAACVLVAGAYAVHRVPHPVRRLSADWTSFKKGSEPVRGSTHFVGLGSNRYDFWRVAWLTFARHPAGGVGVDNFSGQYLRERRSYEEPRYPHSIELRMLSGTGLVGALLFVGFLVAVGLAIARRHPSPYTRSVVAAAVLVFVSWLLHGSVDWLWEFPALSTFAFLGAGIACSLSGPEAPARAAVARPPRGLRIVALVAFGGACLALAVSVALPWLAARDVDLAARTWRTDRSGAFALLDRARRLNPLSEVPDLYAGAIAAQVGDRSHMQASYAAALRRDPSSWYATLELGALYAVEGRRREALDYLTRAARLNPRDYPGALALQRARTGRPLPISTLDRLLAAEVSG